MLTRKDQLSRKQNTEDVGEAGGRGRGKGRGKGRGRGSSKSKSKSNLVKNNNSRHQAESKAAPESDTGLAEQPAEVTKADPPSKGKRQKKQGEQAETKKTKDNEEEKVSSKKAKTTKTKKNQETAEEKEIEEKPRKKKKTNLETAEEPASSSKKVEEKKGNQDRLTRQRQKSTVEPEAAPLPPSMCGDHPKFKRSIMKGLAEFIDSTEWDALELDDLKPHVRALLPTYSRCRLNIYWSRGACGVGFKGKGDFGYFNFASMKEGIWSFKMVAAIAAASRLVAGPVL